MRASAIIDTYGEAMTLKRSGETDLGVKGKRLVGGIEETGGSSVHQEFRIRLSVTQLAASAWSIKAPRRTDSIVVDGRTRTVLDVTPLLIGSTVALYELLVAG